MIRHARNSTFADGDWDGDGDFTTSDLVLAFQAGAYVAASRPVHNADYDQALPAAVAAMPDPPERVTSIELADATYKSLFAGLDEPSRE